MINGSNAPEFKHFLNPQELADFLNISKTTVYRLIEKRQIPFCKIGGSLRFKMEDVLRFIEGARIETIEMQIHECKKKEQ